MKKRRVREQATEEHGTPFGCFCSAAHKAILFRSCFDCLGPEGEKGGSTLLGGERGGGLPPLPPPIVVHHHESPLRSRRSPHTVVAQPQTYEKRLGVGRQRGREERERRAGTARASPPRLHSVSRSLPLCLRPLLLIFKEALVHALRLISVFASFLGAKTEDKVAHRADVQPIRGTPSLSPPCKSPACLRDLVTEGKEQMEAHAALANTQWLSRLLSSFRKARSTSFRVRVFQSRGRLADTTHSNSDAVGFLSPATGRPAAFDRLFFASFSPSFERKGKRGGGASPLLLLPLLLSPLPPSYYSLLFPFPRTLPSTPPAAPCVLSLPPHILLALHASSRLGEESDTYLPFTQAPLSWVHGWKGFPRRQASRDGGQAERVRRRWVRGAGEGPEGQGVVGAQEREQGGWRGAWERGGEERDAAASNEAARAGRKWWQGRGSRGVSVLPPSFSRTRTHVHM